MFYRLLFCLSFFFTVSLLAAEETPIVLVTVAPHKFFVEKVAGDTVTVQLMVPAGASAHTFEPTARQMLTAGRANIWFRTGESFEGRAVRALQSHNTNLVVVDLRQGLPLIAADHHCSHAHHDDCKDLHFWLSARLAKIQANTIATALTKAYPANKELYERNLKIFHQELDALDSKIQQILEPIRNRNIFVSHPAYAYFCRDYGLAQYSIEYEGKDPTPQQLTKVLNLARELKIKTIFVQMQYSSKGARLIADEIGAKVVTLDPYAEQYEQSMLEIAHAFAEG